MVAKLSSDRIIRPAFLATSVPVPMAIPMSAALMAGASLTPSPVMATTSPFFFSVSARRTFFAGASPPLDAAEAAHPVGLGQGGDLGAEDGLAADADLLGDGRTGGDVVAGHHAYPDIRRLSAGHRVPGLVPRRVDHPDQAGQLQLGHVAEQVTAGVEGVPVEVPHSGGHHPPAPALPSFPVGPLRLPPPTIPPHDPAPAHG